MKTSARALEIWKTARDSSGGLAFDVRAVKFSGPGLTLPAPPPPPTSARPALAPREALHAISPLCLASGLSTAIPSMRRK